MADNAWLHLMVYDPEISGLTEACLAESDVSIIHPYVPPIPGDWKAALGIQTELHMIDGSLRYSTAAFLQLREAVKAKVV